MATRDQILEARQKVKYLQKGRFAVRPPDVSEEEWERIFGKRKRAPTDGKKVRLWPPCGSTATKGACSETTSSNR